MRTLIGVALISLTLVHADKNDTLPFPDLIKILSSEPLEGVSKRCADDLGEYFKGIFTNKKLWALQMFDSITKFPDGVLMGHYSIPGQFDECVNAVNEKFSGKHCMVSLGINWPTVKILNDFYDREEYASMGFSYGICVPSTCNSTDLENAFKTDEEYNFVDVKVNETDCSTSELRPFRTEDWITVGILIVTCIVALGSTAYELSVRSLLKKDNPHELWSSFSIYSNGKQLFRISQSTAQLKCLHGIRFLSMCWVILGHSYFSYLTGIPANIVDLPKFLNDKGFIPVSNAFVSVDSFFFLSGLLVCLVFFRDISRKKTYDVPVAFIHRYMRLTPPFAILILIQGTIISRLGNGPFWNVRSDAVEEACRTSWWSGILYVQNYVHPTAMCLGQAWYLSADMQMYWVSPLILYPMLWFPSLATFFLILLILAAAFTNFAIAFVNGFAPNLIAEWSIATMTQFEIEYVTFHTRMAPWLIGLATGYIICGIQAKKIQLKMSKLQIIIGWIAGIALLGGSLFGYSRFIPSGEVEFSRAEAAFYLAFHRVGWALGMAWVVIACVAGYGGPVNDLLSLDCFQPLGKLSYCNFLIHMTLQNFRINSSRTNQYMRHFDIVYSYFADLLFSNLMSIPIVLLFEFPFTRIDRYFFQKLEIFPFPKPKKEKENGKNPEPVQKLENLEKGNVNPSFTES